jgi:glucose-1-phosphate cytidylyltransferase
LLAVAETHAELPVVILCGGRGLRLQEHTQSIPKPLVEIGGRPILWHVIQIYLGQGFRRFLLSTGYKGDLIERYVQDESWAADAQIECVDTGEETPTGGRIAKLSERVGGGTFAATYSDGVANLDLEIAVGRHREHGRLATMTVARPKSQFGVCEIEADGRVAGFHEKPRLEQWINGGFFFFEPGVFEYIGEASVLEQGPLEGLAADGELHAFRHDGFWECMDTYKDAVILNDLWARGEAPWKLWS